MVERLTLILALSVAAMGAYYLFRQLHVRRMATAPAAGRPTLLYFRADHCATCPTQARFVDHLAAQWGEGLRVERVDAERDPATAARYRVFTLPTTILIDGEGHVRQVNYGLADAQKLDRQVTALVRGN
jgi:thioredoxin 1